ncbi:MAG: hypothetical protein AAF228_08650 [Pseudomonadota bacterium]
MKTNELEAALVSSQKESAEYLVMMIEELRMLAHKSEFDFLCYLLEMAKDEALSQMDNYDDTNNDKQF